MPRLARALLVIAIPSYPIVSHAAMATGRHDLTALALLVLIAIASLGLWAAQWNIGALAFGVVGSAYVLSAAHTEWLFYLPPVLLNAFFALLFGRTLRADSTPLITRFIEAVHGPNDPIDDHIRSYARGLTWTWASLFASLALINLLLALCAEPAGILRVIGVPPPAAIPQTWWSAFANFIGYAVIIVFALLEWTYRRRRFPQQRYRGFIDFAQQMYAVRHRVFAERSPS